MRENTVERAFIQGCKNYEFTQHKMHWPDAPDRALFLPGGRIIFVELKRPGGEARETQEIEHFHLRALGFEVYVVDTLVKVRRLLNETLLETEA